MMDHDPSRSPLDSSEIKPTKAARLRDAFSRERIGQFADRLGLARIRKVPGIGWVISIAAIALFIQGVGLANLVAVNEEKQQWSASAELRKSLAIDIQELEQKKIESKKEYEKLTSSISDEAGRLAVKQAALERIEQLRDEAQREQGAASNDAARQREASETLIAKNKELATRIATTEAQVLSLEQDRDRMLAEVAASKKNLDDHRAEVARASAHASDLDTKAAVTLEAIRKSREAQIKAQSDLDAIVAQTAKASATLDATNARLAAATEQLAIMTSNIEELSSKYNSLKTALASDKKLAEEALAARMAAESELAAVKDKLDKAGKTLAEKQGAIAAEESLFAAAQARHDAIKSRIPNQQAELKPLEEQRLSLDADIAGKRKEIETLRERFQAAMLDLKSMPKPVANPSTPSDAPAKPEVAPASPEPAPASENAEDAPDADKPK